MAAPEPTNLMAVTVWGAPNIHRLTAADVEAIEGYWMGTGVNGVIRTTAGARVPLSSVVAIRVDPDDESPRRKRRKGKGADNG